MIHKPNLQDNNIDALSDREVVSRAIGKGGRHDKAFQRICQRAACLEVERDEARQRIAELEAALRPFCADSTAGLSVADGGLIECYWCGNLQGGPSYDFVHEGDCEIMKARAVLEQGAQAPAEEA